MFYYDVLMRGTRGPNPVLTYASEEKLAAGQIVQAPLGRGRVVGMVLKTVAKPDFKTKTVSAVAGAILPRTSRHLIQWLAKFYGVSPSIALRLATPAAWPKTVKNPEPAQLKSRGLDKLKPNSHQLKAAKQIINGRDTTYLLHGETASGKTLVYRHLVKKVLAEGKSALILVPEIALTPQVVADFSDLGEQVFVSHSGLSSAQRQRLWLYCLQQATPTVIIGPRSTLFYPLPNIGLVVVDEAHEQSYKQEQSPRYQAQTVAAKLVELHGGKLVLGSATPRVSDYWQALNRPAPIIKLPRHKPNQADVDLIDQTKLEDFGRSRIIGEKLLSQLDNVLARGGQSLLYLNRRGTAAMALCSDCSWTPTCPRCEFNVSLHHDLSSLVCHQCGWRGRIPVNCPVCGSSELIYKGAGTKAVEREIVRLFPAARVGRFDSDNPKHLSFNRLYPEIFEGKFDIIIGTQSLAVGLDLPELDLVGVISADSELYLPDYTAGERTFQLLYQVMGRAGRKGGGRVVVQTHSPAHPAIANALKQDYRSFYDNEIKQRQSYGYPPFRFLMVAVFEAGTAAKAESAAEEMALDLTRRFGLGKIMGPAPAFYAKRSGKWRYSLVIKSKQRAKLVEAAVYLAGQRGWQTDIDPVNLLV